MTRVSEKLNKKLASLEEMTLILLGEIPKSTAPRIAGWKAGK